MGVRALQARIECDVSTLQHLWRTHSVYNSRLPQLLKLLFQMRRGECGRNRQEYALYQLVAQFVLDNSQNAEYLLNSVSMHGWKPATAKKYKAITRGKDGQPEECTGDSWADKAAKLSNAGVLLYDKQDWFGDLPGCMRQMLCRDSAAIINGHEELSKNWEKDHAEWLHRKAEWEGYAEHQQYLLLRPRFEAFEQAVGGKAAKRRGRWHRYFDWLSANPDLAGWRGGAPEVQTLSDEARERVRKAKPWKQRSAEADEFWKANPELQALDRLHGFYEREFVRRRKTKKNVDGFDHRPTFTLPHAMRHPRWFVFNAPQTNPSGYRALRLPDQPGATASIDLLLLTGDRGSEAEYPSSWVTLCLRADPRLGLFRTTKVQTKVNRGKRKGQTNEKDGYEFFDRHLKCWRPTVISGAKLLFRQIRLNDDGSLHSAVPYLIFTCSADDLALTERAKKIEWSETGEVTKTGKARKSKRLPNGLVACAVDLGLRHAGFATIATYEEGTIRVLRSRNIWLQADGGGPDLGHIAQHKKQIRRLRRQRGRPIAGEESHTELQDHITHMGTDRFKKAARGVINFAWNVDGHCDRSTGQLLPRADVILIERLAGFIPDAERERGVNRALVAWNRGQLVERLKEMAADAGFKGRVFEVNPAGTSQVCSRCGSLGRRFSIVRDGETNRPVIQFGWVEKLFACPKCRYRANADHNASVNLHRKFLSDSAMSQFFEWSKLSDKKRKQQVIHELEEELRPRLEAEHGVGPSGIETPF